MTLQLSHHFKSKELFSLENNSIVYSGVTLITILGLSLHGIVEYDTYPTQSFFIRDVALIAAVVFAIILELTDVISRKNVLTFVSYTILFGLTLLLRYELASTNFDFEPFFLKIQLLVIVLSLVLAVYVRPEHKLYVGAYNLFFVLWCFTLVEYPMVKFLMYTFIVSFVIAINYVVFKRVILLKNDLIDRSVTISDQNKDLMELDDFRKNIIKVIAHDLRNPVGQIASLVSVMNGAVNQREKEECMRLLNSSVAGTYELLESLLGWAMQTELDEHNFEKLNMYQVVNSLKIQFEESFTRKKIKINNEVANDLKILFSRDVINTVLRNLLNNAIKFSPENSTIKIASKEEPTFYSLSVYNKSEEVNPKLITKFNKGGILPSKLGTSNEKGSGSGLFICKSMLEKCNGRLQLEVLADGFKATIQIIKSEKSVLAVV